MCCVWLLLIILVLLCILGVMVMMWGRCLSDWVLFSDSGWVFEGRLDGELLVLVLFGMVVMILVLNWVNLLSIKWWMFFLIEVSRIIVVILMVMLSSVRKLCRCWVVMV